jgi:hypothetical protein
LVVVMRRDFCSFWPKKRATAVLAPSVLRSPRRRIAVARSITLHASMPSLARRRFKSSPRPNPTLRICSDSSTGLSTSSAVCALAALPIWNR